MAVMVILHGCRILWNAEDATETAIGIGILLVSVALLVFMIYRFTTRI